MKNRIHYAFTSLADTVSPFRPSLLVSFLMYTTNIECSPHHFRSVPIQLERHSSTCCHDDVKLEAFFKCHTDDILAIFWSSSPAQKKHTHTQARVHKKPVVRVPTRVDNKQLGVFRQPSPFCIVPMATATHRQHLKPLLSGFYRHTVRSLSLSLSLSRLAQIGIKPSRQAAMAYAK